MNEADEPSYAPVIAAERITAAEAERAASRVAARLGALGLVRGDRVAVIADPSVAYLCAVYGALRSGVVPVLLNPGLLPEEQDVLITDADPATVLRDAEVHALAADGDTAAVDLGSAPACRPMLYTSGTTGRPKGVWSGLLSPDDAAAAVEDERAVWGFDAADVNLVVSPLYHSAPMRFAVATLLAGGDVVVPGRFEVHRIAEAIVRHRPTTAFMAPPHLQRLLGLPDRPDLAGFRLLAHAGAPCPDPVKLAAIDAFGERAVWEFYGSTEGQFTACSTEDWRTHPGTVGPARPGRELRVDEHGVIWCRPPSHARFEYWRDPDRTDAAWDDGFFTVGDLGRLDDGYLWLEGRRDDLIISGGVNVYPVEVERVLQGCPGVEEVAVFPVDDEQWGQMVCAAVVGPATTPELERYAREHLAAWKRPKRWVPVDEITVSPTGKVRRSAMARDLGVG